MKPLSNHRITKFVAVAAFAGLSIVGAYAQSPNRYIAPANSPIDTNTITDPTGTGLNHGGITSSVSVNLDNYNNYLSAIQAKLDALVDGTGALATSSNRDTVLSPEPLGLDGLGKPYYIAPAGAKFAVAVAQAVQAAPGNAAGIVAAGVQFMPSQLKLILTEVAKLNPSVAPQAVGAASLVLPDEAADAAAGAILGIIASDLVGANNGKMADAAAAAVNASTRAVIFNVAKTAVASTKKALPLTATGSESPTSAQAVAAKAVAAKLMDAFLADVLATDSNAALYIDDVARGGVSGVQGFPPGNVTKTDITKAMLAAFNTHLVAKTEKNVVNFAMGAIQGADILPNQGAGNFGTDVRDALLADTATIGATGALHDAVAVGARINIALRQEQLINGDLVVKFTSELIATDFDHIYAAMSGAVQFKAAKAANFVTAAIDKGNLLSALDDAKKQSIIQGAIAGNFASISSIVSSAIKAVNGLAPDLAVAAAIPAATELQSGLALTAAIKNGGSPRPALSVSDAQAVLAAAITAADTAGYERALPDIAEAAAVARKDIDNQLVETAIATVPSGWEEAVAAFVIANNPKDVLPSPLSNNKAAAIAAALTKGGAGLSNSVTLATELAIRAKASTETQFDDAVAALHGTLAGIDTDMSPTKPGNEIPGTTVSGAANPRAVLFGIGAANNTLTIPVLAAALRLGSGVTGADMLNYAISLNKTKESVIRLGYETAQDVIAHPENLFDVVDHKIATNTTASVEITQAAVAARPEYAHYVARAAAFRSPTTVQKTAGAAIQFAHMRDNPADDPAAVAAISSGAVLGLKDAKLTINLSGTALLAAQKKEQSLMAGAVTGMVKASLLFTNYNNVTNPLKPVDDKNGLQGAVANFPEATGAGSTVADVTNKRSKGTAAVVTGSVAQLQTEGAVSLNPLAAAVLNAAAKAMKSHALAFAQAAGAAAEAVANSTAGVVSGTPTALFADFASIARALLGVGTLTNATVTALTSASLAFSETQLINAAMTGAAQFRAGTMGAGAAGLRNYTHHSGLNSPVTALNLF